MLSQIEFKVVDSTNEQLEKLTHEWLREAVFFLGASWYTNRKDFKTVYGVSEKLKLRWLYGHGGKISVAIEQREGKSNWVGGYSIGNQNPFLLDCFPRSYAVDINDIEMIESVAKLYLPEIEVVRCYFCGNRFGNTRDEGQWRCSECAIAFSPERGSRVGFVYVFGSTTNGYYKIGCGNKPGSRLKDYERSKLPFSVEMIHVIPVDDKEKAEAELHRLFRENRTNGEWFKLTNEELSKVTCLKRYIAGHWSVT